MMQIIDRGVVFASHAGTDRQSCAFPQVAVLPSGRWISGCRAGCTKTGNEGQHVLLAWSDDEGQNWSDPRRPFAPPVVDGKPGQFRALALTPLGGQRVLACLYWVDYSDPSLPFFNERTEGLLDSRLCLAVSEDEGETWSEPELVDTSPFHVPTPITGPVLVLTSGEWAIQFELNKTYYDPSPWVHRSVIMFSNDQGNSWPIHAVVSHDPENRIFYWDQRPSVLDDGTILDLFWTYDTKASSYLNIHARSSMDLGVKWSDMWDTGVPGQPAPPVSLKDGRIAMVYVDRTGSTAIKCRLSADLGKTWPDDTELTIYDSAMTQSRGKTGMADAWSEMGKFSVGLPATARLPDGDVLVVYYAGRETDRTSVEWARLRNRQA